VQLPLTPALIRKQTRTFREQVLCDLREEGYSFSQIAEILGVSRQRASQLEGVLVRRALAARSKKSKLARPVELTWRETPRALRRVSADVFYKRLNGINTRYEIQFDRILKDQFRRRKFGRGVRPELSTLFSKTWPLIKSYQGSAFNFSKLVGDFAVLVDEPHLSQLLSRLRAKGFLRKVGTVRVGHHNLPEIFMVEVPVDQHAAFLLEELVLRWSRGLSQLEASWRIAESTQSLLAHFVQSHAF